MTRGIIVLYILFAIMLKEVMDKQLLLSSLLEVYSGVSSRVSLTDTALS